MQKAGDRLANAIRPCLENLEQRRLLNGALEVWANDNWAISVDQGAPGLSVGDTVRTSGRGDSAPVVTRTFGVDAFSTISAAVAAAGSGATVHVLSGRYIENVVIDKALTLQGQGASTILNGAGGESVVLVQASDVHIRLVTIQGGGGVTEGVPTVGIDVNGGTTAINNATVTGNDIGVRVSNGGNISSMQQNFITNNTDTGLEVESTAGSISAVFNNDFSGPGTSIENAAASTVNASGNWHGVTTQAGVSAEFTGLVDVTPWLHVGTDTSGTAGFQGSFTDVNVGSIGQQVGVVGRIQEGINHATGGAGSEVFIHSGTYVESDISVSKSLVLDGVGAASSQIVAPAVADGHLLTPGVVFNPLSHNAFIIRASNVSILDLTIDGDAGVGGPGSRNYFGGVVYDYNLGGFNNTSVTGLTVQNLWGVGIYVDGGIGTESSGNTVSGNTVTDISGGAAPTGILMIQASGSVTNNDVSEVESGISTNFVDGPAFAPNLVIQGNDLSDVSGGIVAAGLDTGSIIGGPTAGQENDIDLTVGPGLNDIGIILQYAQAPVSVQNNIITASNRDAGIWLYQIISANSATISGNTLTASSSANSAPGEGAGIFASDDGDFFGDPGGGPIFATVSGNTIDGFFNGVSLYRSQTGGGFTVQLTVNGNNEIRDAAGTGISVFDDNGTTAANAVAIVSGNSASIHGNAVGIDVDGGSATVTGNHIYDNTIGVQVRNSGTASLDNNNFDGGVNPDNSTDLQLTSSPGTVTVGGTTPNSFAGNTFFIDDLSTQNINAINNTYDEASNFRIEDKMHHRVDTDLLIGNGLITWVANNLYITAPGGGSTDSTIQRGVDAASAGNTVNVESGTYDQVTDVNKGVTVLGIGTPTITRTTGSSQTLMTVSADNVTIQNFDFDVARPFANAGIAALNPATFDNLLIHDNNFDISGTGGSFPNPFLATSSVAIALLGNGTPFESVTVTSNVINFSAGPTLFARGVWLREIRATIGGATPADGNSIIASTQDVLMQFSSGGTSTIQNNTMTGAGVDITEPNSGSPVMITDNDFLPASPLFPQSVLVKNADSSPVTVSNNTFTGHTVGVLSAGSTGTVVSDNDFTPAVGASSFSHVRVDTRVPTGGPQPPPFLPNSVTITGNDFNESTVAGGIGVELLNGNPGASVPDFGTVTVGGAGALANTFQDGLSRYIRLDQGATPPYAPVPKDLDGTQNLYQVSGGTKLPAAMTLAERFELEDKIIHKVDVGSLGFVTVVPGRVFVTTNSFEAPDTTTASIQRGVDAASSGDTVHVAAGTYAENSLDVNKSITMLGAQSGVDARGRVASETIITEATANETLALVNITAANVVMDGFTVDGNGPLGGGVLLLDGLTDSNAARGILVDANNTQLLNNRVQNIYRRGIQFGFNISPIGGSVSQSDFNRIGSDNTLAGANAGFAMLAFADPSFTDNDVNNTHNGAYFIQVYSPNVTPIVVSGNDISARDLGIALNETSSALPVITISNNTVATGTGGIGLLLWTVDGTSSISANSFTGSGAGSMGIYAWDGTANDAMNVTINGGSFIGYETGVYLTNEETTGPFGNALNDATLTLDSVTISAVSTGVFDEDTGPGVENVRVNILDDSNISTGATGTGVKVSGPLASAKITDNDNSITSNSRGVDVDGGVALLQNNNLNGNTIGVLIQNGGIADLGQTGPGTNYTGLGISTGGNNFNGYTTTATTTSGAIVNLKNNAPNNVAGRQGTPDDVLAFNNLWTVSTAAGIENVVYHDIDDPTRGFVDYAVFGNLSVSLTATVINEGGSTTVNGSFTNVATTHTVTINWGDGSPNSVVALLSGVENFSIPSPAATYTDDPNGPVNTVNFPITVTVEEDASMSTIQDTSLSVTVNNVAPTIAVTGNANVNEGSLYTLNLGLITDPGDDTVFRYIINWGDGVFTDTTANPENTVHNHTYDDGTILRNVIISLFDEDGSPHANAGNPKPFPVTVNNVDPTATFFNGGAVSEGSNGLVGFAAQFDPSVADTNAGFSYSYDFNNDGDFADSGELTDVASASTAVPALYLADGPAVRTVRGRIKDKDGGFTDYTTNITVNNVTPVVNGGPNIVVPATVLFNQNGNFVDPGADSPWVGKVDFEWNPGDLITDGDVVNLPLAGFNFTLSHTYNTPGPYVIRVYVTDKDGATGTDDVNVTVGPAPTFQVNQFLNNPSGFTVKFNRAADTSVLNLYDGLDGITPSAQPTDVTLVGNVVGAVRGSLVWDASTNTATFVRTGGPLAADTYTVTVRSAANAWKDGGGNLLDGNADNTPGDNFVTNFVVAPAVQRTLSIPDFSRGPDSLSNINIPNTSALGLPVRIDDGTQVRSIDVTVTWDPALLTVTAAQLGAGVPGDWSIASNLTTPGTAIITVFGTTTDLPAGAVNIIRLVANVPNTAPYTAGGVLRLSNITVSRNDASVISTRGDAAVHKVLYFGDGDADRIYTGFDAGLISRVVVGLDTGFHESSLVDPIITADTDGSGGLTGIDASFVAQKAAFLPRPEIPNLPGVLPPLIPGGVDPLISGATNVPGRPGGDANMEFNIDDATNTLGFNVTLGWDTNHLDLFDGDVTLGSLYANAGGWTLVTNVSDAGGTATLVLFRSTGIPMPGGSGPILNANFHPTNTVVNNQLIPVDVDGTGGGSGLVFTFSDGSILIDAVNPTVLTDTYTYQTSPHKLDVQFSENVSASLATSDFVVHNVTTNTTIPSGQFTLGYSVGTNTATLTYIGGTFLPDGNYTLTINAANVTDAAGNPLPANHVFPFFFMMADFDHNGNVNLNDFNILAANFGQSPRNFTQGDADYNGVVNLLDFNILAARFGSSLGPEGQIVPPFGGESLVAPSRKSTTTTTLNSSTTGSLFSGKPVERGVLLDMLKTTLTDRGVNFGDSYIGRSPDGRMVSLIE